MEDLALGEGLADVVAWGDEEEDGQEEGEDGEGCGVEDAEEGDVRVRAEVRAVHGMDIDVACIVEILL